MPIQTGLLRGLRKSSGGTGIVIPVKKVPQERKIQESLTKQRSSVGESFSLKI